MNLSWILNEKKSKFLKISDDHDDTTTHTRRWGIKVEKKRDDWKQRDKREKVMIIMKKMMMREKQRW